MPRTFSRRNGRWTAQKLFDILDNYLSDLERERFEVEFQERFRQEPGLEEQDLQDIFNIINRIRQLMLANANIFDLLGPNEVLARLYRRLLDEQLGLLDAIRDIVLPNNRLVG